jgi:hypothetical protein
MKRFFVTICISIAAFAVNSKASAQDGGDRDEIINLSVDVASGFVWRGLANNMSPVIQPSFTFSPGKFSIGTWASVPFIQDWEPQELDVFVNYQITPSIAIGICDYYIYGGNYHYFDFKKTKTGHAFDLQLSYDGIGKFPIKAMVSTIIAGDDLNNDDKNNFSTYIELGYGNKCRGVDWEVCAGFIPMKSNMYELYKEDFNVVNLGLGVSKSFAITPTYSLPLALNFTVIPSAKTAFLVAKITLF